jgi:hypothetical protein
MKTIMYRPDSFFVRDHDKPKVASEPFCQLDILGDYGESTFYFDNLKSLKEFATNIAIRAQDLINEKIIDTGAAIADNLIDQVD